MIRKQHKCDHFLSVEATKPCVCVCLVFCVFVCLCVCPQKIENIIACISIPNRISIPINYLTGYISSNPKKVGIQIKFSRQNCKSFMVYFTTKSCIPLTEVLALSHTCLKEQIIFQVTSCFWQ